MRPWCGRPPPSSPRSTAAPPDRRLTGPPPPSLAAAAAGGPGALTRNAIDRVGPGAAPHASRKAALPAGGLRQSPGSAPEVGPCLCFRPTNGMYRVDGGAWAPRRCPENPTAPLPPAKTIPAQPRGMHPSALRLNRDGAPGACGPILAVRHPTSPTRTAQHHPCPRSSGPTRARLTPPPRTAVGPLVTPPTDARPQRPRPEPRKAGPRYPERPVRHTPVRRPPHAKRPQKTRFPRPERFCLGTLGGAGGTRTHGRRIMSPLL